MTTYDVLVTREASEHTTIRVDATTPEEAETKALEEAQHVVDVAWELDEGNFHKPYICDPGNCAEEVTENRAKATKVPSVKEVLQEFIRDIDDSGGIERDSDGIWRPAADPEWSDLAATYINACNALGIAYSGPEEDEDEEVTDAE